MLGVIEDSRNEFKEELVINKNINKVKYTTCLLEIIKKTVFTMF